MLNMKFAFRTLLKTPFVTIVAIVSLALGIGANAAIFSLFDQMLLRALPVQQPDRKLSSIRTKRYLSGRGLSVGCRPGMMGNAWRFWYLGRCCRLRWKSHGKLMPRWSICASRSRSTRNCC